MVALSEMCNMFWGVTLDGSGKRYTQVVERGFHISMAALDTSGVKADGKDGPHVSVMIQHDKAEFLLCTLQQGRILQQALDLNFTEGEDITFFLKGKGVVHLTGYLVEDEPQDELTFDDGVTSTDEEEEEVTEDEEIPKLIAKKAVKSTDTDESDDDEEEEAVVTKGKRKKNGIVPKKSKKAKIMPAGDSDDDDDEDDEDFSIDSNDLDSDLDSDDLNSVEMKFLDKEAVEDSDVDEEDDDEMESENSEDLERMSGSFIQTEGRSKSSRIKVNSSMTKSKEQTAKSKKGTPKAGGDEQTGSDTIVTSASEHDTSPSKKKKRKRNKNKQEQNGQAGSKPSTPKAQPKQSPGGATPASSQKGGGKGQKKVLEGGVLCEETKEGHGPVATPAKTVQVYYTGRLENGKIFDEKAAGKPFKFKLGKSEVIKGWDIGIKGMKVGGKRKLTVPAKMAYGKEKVGNIPPNSTLVFDVELKAVS